VSLEGERVAVGEADALESVVGPGGGDAVESRGGGHWMLLG
jgi:hypothetical protein